MPSKSVSQLTALTNLSGQELFYADSGTADVKVSADTIRDFCGVTSVQVFNVLDYEPNGTDITGALRRARDAAVAAGGGRIYIPTGDWVMDGDASPEAGGFSIVDLSSDNLYIEGDGYGSAITVNHVVDFGGFDAFNWWGGFTAQLALADPIAENDETITLADASSLEAGDLIIIQGGADSGYSWANIVRIKSIAGNAVTLHGTVPFAVDNSGTDEFIAGPLAPIKGGGASNLRFIQGTVTNETFTNCLGMFVTEGQVFENLWFEGWRGVSGQSGAAVRLEYGYGNTLRGLHLKDGGSAFLHDLWVIKQSALNADDVFVDAAFNFGLGFDSCSDCNFGKIICKSRDTSRPLKINGCRRNIFTSIISDGSQNSGAVAVSGSSCNNRFGQLILRGPGTVGGDGFGLWHSDENNTGNSYLLVDSRGWADSDIAFFASDTGNHIVLAMCDTITNQGEAHIGFSLNNHAKASLPTGLAIGAMIYVTDEAGGAVPAFFDGTNWRRVTDRNIVS